MEAIYGNTTTIQDAWKEINMAVWARSFDKYRRGEVQHVVTSVMSDSLQPQGP